MQLQSTFKLVSDIYNSHLSTNINQWKVKEPGKLHYIVCLEGPLPRTKTFSQGNILHPHVFELLQIIYVHANITITSPDEDLQCVVCHCGVLSPGQWIYSNFWIDLIVPRHGVVVNWVTLKLASFGCESLMKGYWIIIEHNCIWHLLCSAQRETRETKW